LNRTTTTTTTTTTTVFLKKFVSIIGDVQSKMEIASLRVITRKRFLAVLEKARRSVDKARILPANFTNVTSDRARHGLLQIDEYCASLLQIAS
jgi:hypothetical protein